MTKRRAPVKRKKPVFSHHKHSGKRLPHHHTGFLPLLFMVLFAGFMLVGISNTAKASSDIVVVGRIPAELPPSAAVISAPVNGEVFTEVPVTVQGTCPAGYLVKLYRNNFFSGSVMCGGTGTFSLETDLFAGSNELTAHIYNITDDEGPLSPAVTVTYNPPLPPPAPPTSDNQPNTSITANSEALPFVLKADSTFKGNIVGEEIEWQFEIIGGTPPYAINIDWGNGKSTILSRKVGGNFIVKHIYDSPGGYKGSYSVRVSGSDDNNQKVFMQLLVVVNLPFNSKSNGILNSNSIKPGFSVRNADAKTIVWAAYSVLLITVGSFWFGGTWQLHHALRRVKVLKHTTRRA